MGGQQFPFNDEMSLSNINAGEVQEFVEYVESRKDKTDQESAAP